MELKQNNNIKKGVKKRFRSPFYLTLIPKKNKFPLTYNLVQLCSVNLVRGYFFVYTAKSRPTMPSNRYLKLGTSPQFLKHLIHGQQTETIRAKVNKLSKSIPFRVRYHLTNYKTIDYEDYHIYVFHYGMICD